MIMSIDEEKAFNKIQHSFWILKNKIKKKKTSTKSTKNRKELSLIMASIRKPQLASHLMVKD